MSEHNYAYDAEDGSLTEDCTEAKALRTSKGPLRLVWDSTPSADALYERLVALMSPLDGDENMRVVSKDELFAGNANPTAGDGPFVVRVIDEGESAVPVEDRIANWLATPNPSLGGDCPRNLLQGEAIDRCRLGYVIAEMEQGAFS